MVPFARTALFLHDPERDVLRLFVVETSLPSTYFFAGPEMPADDSHVGWAFRNERPLLRRDLAHERQYPMEDRAYGDGVRSYMIVPLQARGRCIGTLAVASTRRNQYTETDVAFLQEAAKQVALAVENMQAYEAMGLAAHLTKCPPCVAYLNTYRKTRNVVSLAGAAQMPPEMKDILRPWNQIRGRR